MGARQAILQQTVDEVGVLRLVAVGEARVGGAGQAFTGNDLHGLAFAVDLGLLSDFNIAAALH